MKGRGNFGDLALGVKILKLVFKHKMQEVNWIHLVQDGIQWRVLVNMAMGFGVS
jgi:hypothetical protein